MNRYLDKQRAARHAAANIGIRFGEQKTLDLLEIALHRLGWGYKRVSDLLGMLNALDDYYYPAFSCGMESDVFQERLDGELRDLVKDHQEFHPFAKRYPEIRQLGYTKPVKEGHR